MTPQITTPMPTTNVDLCLICWLKFFLLLKTILRTISFQHPQNLVNLHLILTVCLRNPSLLSVHNLPLMYISTIHSKPIFIPFTQSQALQKGGLLKVCLPAAKETTLPAVWKSSDSTEDVWVTYQHPDHCTVPCKHHAFYLFQINPLQNWHQQSEYPARKATSAPFPSSSWIKVKRSLRNRDF